FEVARSNFQIHFDEWREKRRAAKAIQREAAVERQEVRMKTRASKTAELPPTLVVGESSPVNSAVSSAVKKARSKSATPGAPDVDQQSARPDLPTITPVDMA